MSLLSLIARPRWLRPAAIEGDPFFEDVLLLLHMNGTALVDSSRFARAFGVGFGSQVSLSSEHRKFGDASLKTVAVFNNVSLIITDPSTDFALADEDFTIEAWVRPTTLSGRHGIADFGPNNHFILEVSDASKFRVFLWNGGGFAIISGTTTVATNTWYHVAVTRSGTTLKLWVNGVEEASAGSATGPPSSSYGVRIGATAAGQFVGFTDEFRITRQARYTETFSVPVKPFPYR
jgi:hypothetical protein